MKHLRILGLLLALTAPAALTACGGEEAEAQSAAESSQTGSCNNVDNLSTCTDLSGEAFTLGESLQQSMCQAGNGTYASGGACPTAGLVGSCQIGGGQLRRYYSTGALAYDAARAQSDCTELFSGTWQAQ